MSDHDQGNQSRLGSYIRCSIAGEAYQAFLPPELPPLPPDRLIECLDAFEKYLHLEERSYASLIDAGLIHVQFETIHPFLDGNGRIGRLLITFFLMMMGDLRQPNLYLSLFFKNNRQEYYSRLSAVRKEGDWEGWLDFFLHGVAERSNQVVATSQAISALFNANQDKIAPLKLAGITARQSSKTSAALVKNVFIFTLLLSTCWNRLIRKRRKQSLKPISHIRDSILLMH